MTTRPDGETHLEDCEFIGNSAVQVGAIYCGRRGTVTMDRCRISDNIAEFGGAIAVDPSTLAMRDCILTGNVASEGGAIVTFDATLNLERCVLTGNSSQRGAGLLQLGVIDSASISDCLFAENSAGWGGAGVVSKWLL